MPMPKTPEQLTAAMARRALPCVACPRSGPLLNGHAVSCPASNRPAVIEAVLPVVRENARLREGNTILRARRDALRYLLNRIEEEIPVPVNDGTMTLPEMVAHLRESSESIARLYKSSVKKLSAANKKSLASAGGDDA